MIKPGKKWLWLLLILIIAAGIGWSKYKGLQAKAFTVTKNSVTTTVTEKGKVVSEGTENIVADLQGTVKSVLVDEGDTVQKGTLLAIMDTSEVEAQIGRLEGELRAASGAELASPAWGNSQINQQQVSLDRANELLKQAENTYRRNQELYSKGALTYVELEQSATDLATKRKDVAQLQQELSLARQQNKGSKLQYEGQKQSVSAQLNRLRQQKENGKISAGGEGMIFAKKVNSGDYVNSGSVLFVVGNLSDLKIETYISARDILNVKKGDTVTVVFKKSGKDIEAGGVITKISPVTQEVTSALGIIEDKVKITVNLTHKPAGINLIPGMAVDVRIVTEKADNVVALPTDAIFSDQGKDYVWVVRNGSAKMVQVETGIEGDELTEIKHGLAENDIVIVDPHQAELKEGVRVTVLK